MPLFVRFHDGNPTILDPHPHPDPDPGPDPGLTQFQSHTETHIEVKAQARAEAQTEAQKRGAPPRMSLPELRLGHTLFWIMDSSRRLPIQGGARCPGLSLRSRIWVWAEKTADFCRGTKKKWNLTTSHFLITF